jgi:hypothetical protein
MKNILLILIFSLSNLTLLAHQDFWVIHEFGNIKTRIITGYEYEEIKKVQIIGKLAEILAKEMNYNEPILLDFNHFYVGIAEPIYFISFDKGVINYKNSNGENGVKLLTKNGIVVRQVSNKFDIINTLKMLEYSIINYKSIKKEQKRIEYDKNYCDWIINSINTNQIVNILKSNETKLIKNIKNRKVYRPENKFKGGFTYFWQNEKYNIVFKTKDTEKPIITLSSIYDIQQKRNTIFIFEKSTEFIVLDTYQRKIISRKLKLENAEENYHPYKIEPFTKDLYTIKFSYFSKKPVNQYKNRISIYSRKNSKLIQDLDELMKK